jgi:predicted nucleotidyltransferase
MIVHRGEQSFMAMKVADAIEMRILSTLAREPDREFYQREIARLAGVSVGGTSQRLRGIVKRGLVHARKSGRMIFYRFNLNDPLARQFKILLSVNRIHDLVRELMPYSRRVILFGSCATGRDVLDSDIDLLVLSQEGKQVRKTVSAHADAIRRKISPVVVSANQFRQLRLKDRALYDRINSGLTLWEVE